MDEIDRRIVERLKADGRESYGAIGADLGLSASAIKRRVDKLVAAGVIRHFTIAVDETAQDPGIEALVEIFCRGKVSPQTLQQMLSAVPDVVYAVTITGDADAMIRLRSRDAISMEQALETIRATVNVERTRSALVLSHLIDRR